MVLHVEGDRGAGVAGGPADGAGVLERDLVAADSGSAWPIADSLTETSALRVSPRAESRSSTSRYAATVASACSASRVSSPRKSRVTPQAVVDQPGGGLDGGLGGLAGHVAAHDPGRDRHRADELLDPAAPGEQQQRLAEQRQVPPGSALRLTSSRVRRRLRGTPAQGRRAEGERRQRERRRRSRGRARPRRSRRWWSGAASRRRRSDSGSTLLTASRTAGSCVAGHEQPAQQDLRDHDQRHELHGLELGLREGADEQAERGAEHGVGDRDHGRAARPGPATSRPSSPTLSATASADWTAATSAEREGVADQEVELAHRHRQQPLERAGERSRSVVTLVTRNITMNGNIASSAGPNRSKTDRRAVLEHPPQQRHQQARQHQQHRERCGGRGGAGSAPGRRRRAVIRGFMPLPRRRSLDQREEGAPRCRRCRSSRGSRSGCRRR